MSALLDIDSLERDRKGRGKRERGWHAAKGLGWKNPGCCGKDWALIHSAHALPGELPGTVGNPFSQDSLCPQKQTYSNNELKEI